MPIIVLKNSIDLFIAQIKSQKSFNEKYRLIYGFKNFQKLLFLIILIQFTRSMDLFVEIFKYVQKLPSTDNSDKGKKIGGQNTGFEYINRKLSDILSVK
jgi:hypothetical protein